MSPVPAESQSFEDIKPVTVDNNVSFFKEVIELTLSLGSLEIDIGITFTELVSLTCEV